MLGRRSFLTGGVVAAGVGTVSGVGIYEGLLPGRPRLQALFGLNGEAGEVPDYEPGPVLSGSFVSEHRRGEKTGWSLLRPPRVSGILPLVVALHALGWDHTTPLQAALGLPQFLAKAGDRGVPPFAIATVDGGNSYWHRRPSGDDAEAMVVDELLPRLRRHGVATRRFGLLGWSMGGYGALRLATDLGRSGSARWSPPARPCGTAPDDARPDGFAGEEEYEQYSVVGRQDGSPGSPSGSTAAPATRSSGRWRRTSRAFRPTPTSSAPSSRAGTWRRTGGGCCLRSWSS